ncbi:DUF3093 domain-containing protein [Helcobacillus massiliensis]|uniref:DUF3093 family protein n=1 Tax=Helcobacillus massiliensis TaxID=521392 RepID=A0A839QR97_9MICO|nr:MULTISPECIES: DUF3093 domain-containing protein [Helcobacillus]MBB3022295.1 hypothetical protein [Helcobacillus massiliensis]MCG7426484.1 DUF3093 domain-containing protein [Helcobacillus sp. ACRRO]MCT1556935.1 DUF3093 domain-containing protein [Helcobacillus massiliensis]MCT2035324.1 DUF3093 domain-containing protein [Helcobacillus massiliensis]MCT2331461.1 DUF3093 domain-containing protein [Helcobacillus massiliensis]
MNDDLFRERLSPGPVPLIAGAVFGALLGMILTVLSTAAGLAVGIAGLIGVPAILILTSPVVRVTREALHAGPAHISTDLLGEPEVLDAERMRRVMGPEIRPDAYRCTRGWIRTGLQVPILDEEDPAPAWVLSLRSPEECRTAILAAQRQGA